MVGGERNSFLGPDDAVGGCGAVQFRLENKNPGGIGIGLDYILKLGAITLTPGGKLNVYLPVVLLR